jgi:hypothetical protein
MLNIVILWNNPMVPPPRNWRGVTCWLLGGTAVVKIRTVAPPLYLNEILRGDYCRYFHDSSPPSVIYEGTTVRIGGTTVGGTTDRKGIGTTVGGTNVDMPPSESYSFVNNFFQKKKLSSQVRKIRGFFSFKNLFKTITPREYREK